eukprot:GHVS01048185.1.p2 GENE.GHVS01048185.1~~GHVS01048185.1.p2  ORF type:complete len:183 (-),score=54.58 GHVS01048185.1:1686-2234(-)
MFNMTDHIGTTTTGGGGMEGCTPGGGGGIIGLGDPMGRGGGVMGLAGGGGSSTDGSNDTIRTSTQPSQRAMYTNYKGLRDNVGKDVRLMCRVKRMTPLPGGTHAHLTLETTDGHELSCRSTLNSIIPDAKVIDIVATVLPSLDLEQSGVILPCDESINMQAADAIATLIQNTKGMFKQQQHQ